MFLIDCTSFWGILFDVVALIELIRFSSRSVSGKCTLLNEKLGIFFKLLLISNRLKCLLYLCIAFSTELFPLLSVSMM